MAGRRKIIRNGVVVDARRREALAADISIEGETIASVGSPGMETPDDAIVVDASDRALIPGW